VEAAMTTSRTVLLTGFGPFPGIPVNASGLLVPLIARAARKRFPHVVFKSLVLPTEWKRGPARVMAAIERDEPAVVIHYGVSPRAGGFVVERRAVNVCLATADGAGHHPIQPVLRSDGPERRSATLPVKAIIAGLKGAGIPVAGSDDAGTYLCNAVLYHSLGRATPRRTDTTMMAGFVHLPASLAGGGGDHRSPRDDCPITRAQVIEGSMLMIELCLSSLD
jgi:pyroglutamyl-peptidase